MSDRDSSSHGTVAAVPRPRESAAKRPNGPGTSFQIPWKSFTAFRLRYSSAQEISDSSRTLLLGGISESWLLSRKRIVASISHRRRALNTLKKFNSRMIGPSDGHRRTTPAHGSPAHSAPRLSSQSLRVLPERKSASRWTLRPPSQAVLDDSSDSDSSAMDSDSTVNGDTQSRIFRTDIEFDAAFEDDPHLDTMVQSLYNQIHWGQHVKEKTYSQKSPFAEPLRSILHEETRSHEAAHYAGFVDESVEAFDAERALQAPHNLTFSEPERQQSSKVDGADRRRSKNEIRKIVPGPTESPAVIEQYSPLDISHIKAVKVLKKSMYNSKHRFKAEVNSMGHKRRLKKILKAFEVGEILKVEKMLVLVKESVGRSASNSLTEHEECDTRVTERWKEYIVVARSNSDPDNPIYVQFESQRNIHEKKDYKLHGIDFRLNTDSSRVTFYSMLDKTISIGLVGDRDRHSRTFYILRTHTVSSAISWFMFLSDIFEHRSRNLLSLSVPALDLSLSLTIPWEFFEDEEDAEQDSSETSVTVEHTEEGYSIRQTPHVEYITGLIGSKLGSNPNFRNQYLLWMKIKDRLTFCFRTSERLQWVPPHRFISMSVLQALSASHVLELRVPENHSLSVNSISGAAIPEPPAVEGFLARLSSRSGEVKSSFLSRPIFKFEYYYTHDNYLMFCSAHNAVPPLFDSGAIELDGKAPNFSKLKEVVHNMPMFYENNPYRLDQTQHFTWLSPDTADSEFRAKDCEALYEFERRFCQIPLAKGVINLCDIVEIRPMDASELPKMVDAAASLIWTGSVGKAGAMQYNNSCFEVIMSSGTSLRLQAPNPQVRAEWITRLGHLSDYWKQRKIRDRREFINFKIHSDDLYEFANASKVPSRHGAPNLTKIYNVNDIALSRTNLMSGELYQKAKKHTTFKKYFAILAPGTITLFKFFNRSSSGKLKNSNGYRHYMTIPVGDAYVFSGTVSSLDLVENEESFDPLHPTKGVYPKIYEGGLLSCESETDRCFTLWFGMKRAIAGDAHRSTKVSELISSGPDKNDHENDTPKGAISTTSRNPGVFKLVSKLGVTGKRLVFMASSKEERDLWVIRIVNNIEKFHSPDSTEFNIT